MRRVIWVLPLLTVLTLAGYVAAGPYLTIRAIAQAIERQDTAALAPYVNYPMLRANLKARLEDALVRRTGPDLQSSLLGSFALRAAGSVTGAGVDAMVTPLGIGALLQGRTLWKRASGDTDGSDAYAAPSPDRPLARYQGRFSSLSRFSASVRTASGTMVVFVLSRDGLRWKLSDIVLSGVLDYD